MVSLLLGVLVILPLSSLVLTEPMGLWGFFNGADNDSGVGVQPAMLPKEPRIEPRLDGAIATPSAPKLVTCATSEAAAERAPPRVRPAGDPPDSRIPPRLLLARLFPFPDPGCGVPLPGDGSAPPGWGFSVWG